MWRGSDFTPVFEADANARTVYVHALTYGASSERLKIDSDLRRITRGLPPATGCFGCVDRGRKHASLDSEARASTRNGFVAKTTDVLDGREASVRDFPTRLTDPVAASMLRAAPGTELAIFNSGSIRIVDVIPPGEVTEYDVIRTLPFAGVVQSAYEGVTPEAR